MQILPRVHLIYNQNKENNYNQYILSMANSVLIIAFFSVSQFCMGEPFASTSRDMFKLFIALMQRIYTSLDLRDSHTVCFLPTLLFPELSSYHGYAPVLFAHNPFCFSHSVSVTPQTLCLNCELSGILCNKDVPLFFVLCSLILFDHQIK